MRTPVEMFVDLLAYARGLQPGSILIEGHYRSIPPLGAPITAGEMVRALESLRLDIPAPADDDALPPEILP